MTERELIKKAQSLKERVTELEGYESEYKNLQKLFGTLFINSPIGLYILQDGCFVTINAEFERISGYSKGELTGSRSLTLILPEDRDRVREEAIKMLKGKYSGGYDFRVFTKTGEIRTILETVVSIQYQGKRAVLANFMDITERKRLEEERERLIQELQENIAKINTLSGLLPICAWCKKLRNDEGYWKSVEEYISEHTGAEFTHSMCPDCQSKYLTEDFPERNSKQNSNSKIG